MAIAASKAPARCVWFKMGESMTSIFKMDLDDFAQVQWLHNSYMNQIVAKMEIISHKSESCFDGIGWTEMHLRTDYSGALGDTAPKLCELFSHFKDSQHFDAFQFWTEYNVELNVSAVGLPSGIVIYGETDTEEKLKIIGLSGKIMDLEKLSHDVELLCDFAKKYDLLLVSWNHLIVSEPTDISYKELVMVSLTS